MFYACKKFDFIFVILTSKRSDANSFSYHLQHLETTKIVLN